MKILGDRDEQAPGVDLDPINEDTVMSGGDRPDSRFEVPAPGGFASELASCVQTAKLGLRAFAGQPANEPGELVSAGDIFTRPDV